MAILYDGDFFKNVQFETYTPERGKGAGKETKRVVLTSLKDTLLSLFKGDEKALTKLIAGALTAKWNAAQSDPDQKFTMPAKRFLQINYFKDVLGVDIVAANPEEPTKEEVRKAIEYLKNPPKQAAA